MSFFLAHLADVSLKCARETATMSSFASGYELSSSSAGHKASVKSLFSFNHATTAASLAADPFLE